MNTFFKRTAVSLVVAGMASIAYAAPAPMQMNGFFIGVEALNLRAMNGDLDYVSTYQNNSSWNTHAVSTDTDWGWRLFGGVKFGDNDDVTVSWFRLRNSSSDDVNFNNSSNYTRFHGYGYDNASAKVTFDLDEAYAVLGHTVHFNNPWSVRFAGGLTYAHLDSDLRVNANWNNSNNISFQPSSGTDSAVSKSDMKGWGPRAEFDATYHLGYNFALFANTNASLLVADRDTRVDWYSDGEYDGQDTFSGRHVVVPKLGMRLGASYTYDFGQAGSEGAVGGSALTFAAGWQVESYIHAVERYEGANSDLHSTKVSNFGDHGLFLGLTYSSSWM